VEAAGRPRAAAAARRDAAQTRATRARAAALLLRPTSGASGVGALSMFARNQRWGQEGHPRTRGERL
jgi:hypothetical protein